MKYILVLLGLTTLVHGQACTTSADCTQTDTQCMCMTLFYKSTGVTTYTKECFRNTPPTCGKCYSNDNGTRCYKCGEKNLEQCHKKDAQKELVDIIQ